MKGYLCFSDKGEHLADTLRHQFPGEIYRSRKGKTSIRELMPEIWNNHDALIFIGATGIAVRMIAPYLKGKDKDPAVVVIDDMGNFVISLLSGHLGGANRLTKILAEQLNAIPVITTATDNRGFEGLDLYARRLNFYIPDLQALTPLTGKIVNGEELPVYNPYHFPTPRYPKIREADNTDEGKSVLAITDEGELPLFNAVFLRPRILHLGIGARRNVPEDTVLDLITSAFKEKNLSLDSIADIATISLKKDEKAILKAANTLNVPLIIYEVEELKAYDRRFKGSDFVRKTVGIGSVSASCAAKSAGNVILEKIIGEGVTLSVSREE